jgi:hypothetical protein
MIPADDPVRLLSAFVEGMDLSELYKTYDRIRKNQATPRQMLKIMLYASKKFLRNFTAKTENLTGKSRVVVLKNSNGMKNEGRSDECAGAWNGYMPGVFRRQSCERKRYVRNLKNN